MTKTNDFTGTVRIEKGSESGYVASMFNHFIDNFNTIILNIRNNIEDIKNSSQELYSASSYIAGNVLEQSTGLDQICYILDSFKISLEKVKEKANFQKAQTNKIFFLLKSLRH